MMPNEILYTIKEVMKTYSISRATLYNWIERGLPVIKNNRIVRFDKDKVWEWFNNENK